MFYNSNNTLNTNNNHRSQVLSDPKRKIQERWFTF